MLTTQVNETNAALNKAMHILSWEMVVSGRLPQVLKRFFTVTTFRLKIVYNSG